MLERLTGFRVEHLKRAVWRRRDRARSRVGAKDLAWTMSRDAGSGRTVPLVGDRAGAGERPYRGSGQQLFVLRAWLGAEVAYEAGHLADVTLQLVQDRVSAELGRNAESRLRHWLRDRELDAGGLRDLADDPVRVRRVLACLLADDDEPDR